MTPTTQKTICFVNKTDCIVDLDLLERACVWFSDKPLVSKKVYIYVWEISSGGNLQKQNTYP